ncbi:oxidoreductase, partial [Mesorhizobium sp. M8A.F.Ca.ET.173.01.1.1]
SIPREDVASVINQVVSSDDYLNTEFQIISGDVEISQALDSFKNK